MADAVPAEYRPWQGDWVNYCGVEGGIPNYTTQSGATIDAYTGTPDAIANAFNSAPPNTFVQLGAGTFNISDNIILTASGVALRGHPDGTTINYTGGGDRSTHLRAVTWDLTNAGQFTTRTVTAPVVTTLRGVAQVTLNAAPTGLVVGQIVFISSDQIFVGDTPSSDFLGKEFSQIVRVIGIVGNIVGFEPPINADYLTGNVTLNYRTLAASIKRSGLENITFTGHVGHYIGFSGADECWALGCTTVDSASNANHILPYGSYRCEIRRHIANGTLGNTNSAYVISPIQSSQLLIEDNWFHNIPNVIAIFGMNGSAVVFNYMVDFPYADNPNWLSQIVFYHGGHCHYNLVEGNIYPSSHIDNFGNTSSRNTVIFRNRMHGWDEIPLPTGKTDNTHCFYIGSENVNFCVAGNVLGQVDYHTNYESNSEFDATVIYALAVTLSGLIRIDNYNTVDGDIPPSESLGGDTYPDSYIYDSKLPYFGYLPWPFVDSHNFEQSDTADNLPAAFRASHGGEDPPPTAGDILVMTKTPNAAAVTELVYRSTVIGGVASGLVLEIVHHSGPYPRDPDDDYAYAKHGPLNQHVYVFNGFIDLATAIALRDAS